MTFEEETTMHDASRYVSVRTICAELDMPERTVRRWVSEGRLPTVRFGRRCVLIPRSEYEAFVAQHRVSAAI